MSSQCQNKTPQPTPGHSHDYSQVTDDDLTILTDNLLDTEQVEKKERECKAKRRKAEEVRQEVEQRQREEEEVQRKKVAEDEAEKQRQKAAAEEPERQRQRAQARWDKAAQRLCGVVYNINTTQKVPGASMVVTATRWPPCTHCVASLMAGQFDPGQGKTRACVPCHNKKKTCSWMQEEAVAGPSQKRAGMGSSQGKKKKRTQGKGKERATEMEEVDDEREAGGEDEEEPATPLEGPLGVSSWWTEWEQEWQLQAAERYAAVHEKAATAFERMARAAEQMAEAAEWTANEWGLYSEFEHAGRGWKRPQSEAAEDKNEEADEGVEGDNEEEEEIGGEKEGREEQEGGGGQAMEE
ncbi:hypothetical protein M404DRAFT_29140 [Pisolithus tinctorius Marx 270]|uniref:Uncharacterized protein n=1 Tax=Pisolithus tinctorius Marx 270 TaxID=870435 RepID=A0A0C3JU11_PISTI|nr:hypothetical protein M404DRAFT_29140 [Pisolithus tinctorius Marx 270]